YGPKWASTRAPPGKSIVSSMLKTSLLGVNVFLLPFDACRPEKLHQRRLNQSRHNLSRIKQFEISHAACFSLTLNPPPAGRGTRMKRVQFRRTAPKLNPLQIISPSSEARKSQ